MNDVILVVAIGFVVVKIVAVVAGESGSCRGAISESLNHFKKPSRWFENSSRWQILGERAMMVF